MLHTVIFKNTKWVVNLGITARQFLASVHNFKETHKTFLMRCAVIFMSVKIGLILLATFSTMAFLLSSVTPYLAGEMSKMKAILFASPLAMIIMLKVYFIGTILMTYDRSRLIMKSVVDVMLLKGRQGLRRIEETIPVELSPVSLEKVRNR